jgi:hypothetical protein
LSAISIQLSSKIMVPTAHQDFDYDHGSQYDRLASATIEVGEDASEEHRSQDEHGCKTVEWPLKQAVCFNYVRVCAVGARAHSAIQYVAWDVLPDKNMGFIAKLVATAKDVCEASSAAGGVGSNSDTM